MKNHWEIILCGDLSSPNISKAATFLVDLLQDDYSEVHARISYCDRVGRQISLCRQGRRGPRSARQRYGLGTPSRIGSPRNKTRSSRSGSG